MSDAKSPFEPLMTFIGTLITVMVFAVGANLINAIWVMLALGVAHHQWPGVPAFGYWPTYLLLVGLYAVGGVLRYARITPTKDGAK